MRIYIDLDDTVFDFKSAHKEGLEKCPGQPYPHSQYGFFLNLKPIDYAIFAIIELAKVHEVYFLTAPSVKNPLSYTEKRLSIEKWFGYDMCSRLIICDNKSLVKGDYLIDDRVDSHKQNEFEGKLMQFGSKEYPNWIAILRYFELI